MARLVDDLNSLDFSVYIGGPLQAAVQAQHAASMSLVEFIQEVGFDDDGIRYVNFEYAKEVPNEEGTSFETSSFTIKVPFLTMLIMPALRIDEVKIDFNAKLTSTQTANVSNEFTGKKELGINYKVVNFKASASYKRTSTRGTNVEKSYNLGVQVRAVNDELPEGLDRILTMLEDSIASIPKQ